MPTGSRWLSQRELKELRDKVRAADERTKRAQLEAKSYKGIASAARELVSVLGRGAGEEAVQRRFKLLKRALTDNLAHGTLSCLWVRETSVAVLRGPSAVLTVQLGLCGVPGKCCAFL